MSLELRVLSGAHAGRSQQFAKPVISVGRHPLSDFRFDPERDLDVSTRHAEIRLIDQAFVLFDQDSTNGTFVNGTRVEDGWPLREGDVISFGQLGPRTQVHLLDDRATQLRVPASTAPSPLPLPGQGSGEGVEPPTRGGPRRRRTEERVIEAVQAQTRTLQAGLMVIAVLVILALIGGYWMGRHDARPHRDAPRADSSGATHTP